MTFEAFWIPGLDTDFDPDEALAIGDSWLRQSSYAGRPTIVLHAAKMTQNRPTLARMATRYEVVSPRTQNRSWGGSHAVLAVWPSGDALEVAEELATPNGGLCVIPGTLEEMAPWISGNGAINLTDPDDEPEPLDLRPEVTEIIDSIAAFDGHNGFISGIGKIDAVRDLRQMVASGHRPDPAVLEAYALQTGDTDHKGAAKLREYYEGILAGRGYRDYRGRPI